MTKIQKRRTACRYKGLDPDTELTPSQACDYAAERGVQITPNVLALLRRDGTGPKYLKINGHWIRYTPRLLEPFIRARVPRLVDPAERLQEPA